MIGQFCGANACRNETLIRYVFKPERRLVKAAYLSHHTIVVIVIGVDAI